MVPDVTGPVSTIAIAITMRPITIFVKGAQEKGPVEPEWLLAQSGQAQRNRAGA